MAKYHVQFPVTQTHGYQIFAVEADSPEHAEQLAREGEVELEFVEEEIEVTNLGEPECVGLAPEGAQP